jgi:hypothetical protein
MSAEGINSPAIRACPLARVELRARTNDGMSPFVKSNTNLPMPIHKKITMPHLASARDSAGKILRKIRRILVLVLVVFNGIHIKL